jgi:hypothetical protein
MKTPLTGRFSFLEQTPAILKTRFRPRG